MTSPHHAECRHAARTKARESAAWPGACAESDRKVLRESRRCVTRRDPAARLPTAAFLLHAGVECRLIDERAQFLDHIADFHHAALVLRSLIAGGCRAFLR